MSQGSDSKFLHGLHDIGGEEYMSQKPGWIVHAISLLETRNFDYTDLARRGFGVICRLNWGWNPNGTIPNPAQFLDFSHRCATFVLESPGCNHWIIGNEFNRREEGPNNQQIDPYQGADCHNLCYRAIKSVDPSSKVLVSAIAPWDNRTGDWLTYQQKLVDLIGGLCDGYAIHAYTHGSDPNWVFSDQEVNGWKWHFHTYRQQIDNILSIRPDALGKEFHITEVDQGDEGWVDENRGFIQNLIKDIILYNESSNTARVRSVSCYRYKNYPNDRWGMEHKHQVMADFSSAANISIRSLDSSSNSFHTSLPIVSGGSGGTSATPPDLQWDSRLTGRGVQFIPAKAKSGELYWKLRKAQWLSEAEAGGRHHIYVSAFDDFGNLVPNVPFKVKWPDGESPEVTKNGTGLDGGNYAMFTSLHEYSVWIDDGHPSDMLAGIGMGADGNSHIHTSTIAEWQLTKFQATSTTETPERPSVPLPSPSGKTIVPPLVFPVDRSDNFPITQEFGKRPEFYGKYKIDGVPLRGHEGIDIGVPVGTPVYVVDAGKVVEAADQGNIGYGKYIKFNHLWGESVYAHLSQILVTVGQFCREGMVIAKSGASGNVDGPHLHFGLRVKPFSRIDGWGGYTNPLPYFASVTSPIQAPPGDAGTLAPELGIPELVELIKIASEEFNIDWRLLLSLIHGESSMNPSSLNKSSGAAGLGQLVRGTWEDARKAIGVNDIFNPKDNTRATAWYLGLCIDLRDGNLRQALWSYNWGPEAVRLNPLDVPLETLHFASKVLHGYEVLSWVESR